MKRLILFDLGGVVNKYADEIYYNYFYRLNGFTKKQVDNKLGKTVDKFESGKLSLSEFEKQVASDFCILPEQVKWVAFFKKLARLDYGTVSIIKRLKPNYKIAFLSNVDRWRYNYAMAHTYNKTKKLFDYKFASFKLGLVKPNPLIYKKVLKATRTKPSEVVFIDNSIKNVKAARSMGITSIHFRNARKLRLQLKRFGVKF